LAIIVSSIGYFSLEKYNALSPLIYIIILIFFIFLLWLSRQQKLKLASLLLIVAYFLPNTLFVYRWGVNLPQNLLLYILIIIMSGILLGTRAAFMSTTLIGIILLFLSYLQSNDLINTDLYWTKEYSPRIDDTLMIVITFFIIAIVSWLSNKEISKSLKRARHSETKLQQERDNLETTVKERTQEIKKMQIEKIGTLYKLAEFGRLSSGIFHDLINPLTAVSLNLQQIKDDTKQGATTKEYLRQALNATNKMQAFITSIKSQIKDEQNESYFSVNQEINNCLQILDYKATKFKVKLIFKKQGNLNIHGIASKLSQIILNLVSNAIESYESCKKNCQLVIIKTKKDDKYIKIRIQDFGSGITKSNKAKIFQPFFSTKNLKTAGLGIGLYSTKNIIEKSFGGSLQVVSNPMRGTSMIVKIPINKKSDLKKSL